MREKPKTHYEEVPLEVAQKIAEEHIAIQPSQAPRSGQYRGSIRKRLGKGLKRRLKVLGEREDS